MKTDSILPVAKRHLLLANAIVWAAPGWMFPRIVKRYSDRILAFPQEKKSLFALLPARALVLVFSIEHITGKQVKEK